MGGFTADYHDGRTSSRRRVSATVEDGRLHVHGDGVALDVPLAQLRVQARMGRLPMRIELPGEGLLVADAEAVSAALPLGRGAVRVHGYESHWGTVMGALAAVLVVAFVGWRWGVPWLAETVAYNLPPEVEGELAEGGLQALDKLVLHPSDLTLDQRARYEKLFRDMHARAEEAPKVALEFRNGGLLGANAFAMPGGTIVVTDQLIRLVGNDDEVMAVLAHELGHVRHRHVTRTLLQSSITAIAATLLLGDVSALAGVAATVPTVVLHNTYSRAHEREADAYGFAVMRRTGRSPQLLGKALSRLEGEAAGRDGEGRSVPAYFSSHPPTAERVQAAIDASR